MGSSSEKDQTLQSEQLLDHDLKEWQQMQINKCRIENIFNKVTEIYRYLEALQAGQDPPDDDDDGIELEESAILMAIGVHGLAGNCNSGVIPREEQQNLENNDGNSLQNVADRKDNLIVNFDDHIVPDSGYGSTNQGSEQNEPTPLVSNILVHKNVNSNEHQQFVENAVSAAIQRQGLGIMESRR